MLVAKLNLQTQSAHTPLLAAAVTAAPAWVSGVSAGGACWPGSERPTRMVGTTRMVGAVGSCLPGTIGSEICGVVSVKPTGVVRK